MLDLTVIILTKNEEKHIARCIESIITIAERIIVIDSGSIDETLDIARLLGADIYENEWINHAHQVNWALQNCEITSAWVMRIDADEYVTTELSNNMISVLPYVDEDISHIYLKRQVRFQSKAIRWGGYYPVLLLRMWRRGSAKCENRIMDEHMVANEGSFIVLSGNLVDENLNDLEWWTNKHNRYSTLEAFSVIDSIYNFSGKDELIASFFGSQTQRVRWFKIKYLKLPLFVRPFVYFFYRYVFRLGFLDGRRGLIWHLLQGFWYRFIVDAKIYEAYRVAGKDSEVLLEYAREKWKIKI